MGSNDEKHNLEYSSYDSRRKDKVTRKTQQNEILTNKLSREVDVIIVVKDLKLTGEAYDEVSTTHNSSKQTPKMETISISKDFKNNKNKDRYDIVEEKDNVKEDSISHVFDSVEARQRDS